MKCFEEKMSYPQFLKYLVPSVLTMIFLSFYTTIDGFFVSRYAGSDALAGINIVIPITCIIFGTAVMFATGSAAIIGEKMGQKREQGANEIHFYRDCTAHTFPCIYNRRYPVFETNLYLLRKQ